MITAALTTTIVLTQVLGGLQAAGLMGRHAAHSQGTAGSSEPEALNWINALTGGNDTSPEVAYVNNLIAHMSLDEEIGQMIVVDFTGTTMTPELLAKIQQYHVGGAILYDRNITSAKQLRALTHSMQAASKIPLLLAIDQEGGTVNRLSRLIGPTPSAERMAASGNPASVRKRGLADGQLMYNVGLNVNLAPVVDVQNVPDSQTYMRYRMFGWTPDKVTLYAGSYLDGLQQDHHVIGTLKHFPGLGGIAANPHETTATTNRSQADLMRIDWAPYRALLAQGNVGLIMTSHIVDTAVDPNTPATLSYPVVTGILRQKLGYNGVIMTDDLYMKGVAARYTFPQRITGAVLAGQDMLCSMFTLGATKWAEQILHDAVTSGKISKQRIDDSVRRILLLKLQYGMLSMPQA
jgi:beta-N-acetylhexosaminidase